MRDHRRLFLIIAAGALVLPAAVSAAPVPAGDSTAQGRGSLVVRADVDSAEVMLDGKHAGVTPLEIDSVEAGMHVLSVFHPDLTDWLTGSVRDSIQILAGERVIRSYRVAGDLSLTSTPSGASIYLRDSLLGFTPLLVPRDSANSRSELTLSLEGYKSIVLQPQDFRRGFVSLSLSPLAPGSPQNALLPETAVQPSGRQMGLYLSGATAVLAGIATAYLKIQADDRQDRYLSTGDPGLLLQRNRADQHAAVSYVIMQIGFGIFAYLLLSD